MSLAPPAMITFAAPALLWGTIAAAAPIIIHLVMRQKSKHLLFPAMRLLTQKMAAGRKAQRLRYLLLLASRTAVILLIVGLLMEARCEPDIAPGTAARTTGEPVSAVICVDDSASMSYRFQGRTRLEAACDLAQRLIEDRSRFGPDCEFAVVTGSEENQEKAGPEKRLPAGLWTADRRRAVQALRQLSPGWHGRGAGMLLQLAYRQLAQARHPRREVYLVTDLTEHAWREPLPAPPKDLAAVCILDAGHHENLNLAAGWLSTGEHVLPTGVSNTIVCRLRTGDAPAEPFLEVLLDGQACGRQVVEPMPPSSEREVALILPAMDQGVHTVAVTFKPDDALPADNQRCACVLAGELPRVAVVADQPDNEVAAMVSAMIAPAALTSIERRYAIDALRSDTLSASQLDGPTAAVLADAARTSAEGWATLRRYVERGGALIVVPGPKTTAAALAAGSSLLPAPIEDIVGHDPPINVAATEFNHPYLRPFADTGIDSINDRPVFRRLRCGPLATGAQTLAPFSDGSPAILARTIGKGRVIQMAFSPARDWGLLGSQAAPMIVLFQGMLAELAPRSDRVAAFAAGETVRRWLDTSANPLTILGPGEKQPRPLPIRSAQVQLPTALPGTYRLYTGLDNPQALLDYGVNVPETESDMTRASPDTITPRFPPGVATVMAEADCRGRGQASGLLSARWTVPVALALLAFLIAESLFANGFYGYRDLTPGEP